MKFATVAAVLSILLLSVQPVMGQGNTSAPVNDTSIGDETTEEVMDETLQDGTVMPDETMGQGMDSATVGPTEGDEMMDMVDASSTMMPSDGAMEEEGDHSNMTMTNQTMPEDGGMGTGEDEGTGISPPPPQELDTDSFLCSAGGVETRQDQCTEYKGNLNNVKCDCYYFCGGGNLVQCLDDGESKAFGCGEGGEVIECFENPVVNAAKSSGWDSTQDTLDALYATVMTALAALICVA